MKKTDTYKYIVKRSVYMLSVFCFAFIKTNFQICKNFLIIKKEEEKR